MKINPKGFGDTMPPAEAAFLADGYNAAKVILEYGAGGSTIAAAELPGRVVMAVDSSLDWLNGIAAWFAANQPESRVLLHHVNIGETKAWGTPKDASGWSRYHQYPLSIWDHPEFEHPDVVLVDGRFRTACFLATLFRASRPVTVYFDDYAERAAYHVIERYAKPDMVRGRMARFRLLPRPLAASDLSFLFDQFTQVL